MKLLYIAIMVLAGAFCIWGAATDRNFFMESHKARLWVRLLGRNGARIFYCILGAVIIVLGIVVGITLEI